MSKLRDLLKACVPAEGRQAIRRAQVSVGRRLGYRKVHWCRVVMNRETQRFVRSLPCHNLDVIEISGRAWGDQSYGFRSYRSLSYPEYDICEAPYPSPCDLVIAEQVFEHVVRPREAARNVFAMLRRGGIFLITTPFLLKIHPCPTDLYRWTEAGLRTMLEDAGFSQVTTGSWGNRKCVIANLTRGPGNWALYHPLLHSLHNEPEFPVSVWAFARKE